MIPWVPLLLFSGGAVIVVAGTEWFVDGAVGLARRWRTSAFFLAVLGFGLEPETLVAGVATAAHGMPGVALGTIVGGVTFLALAAVGAGGLVALLDVARSRAHRTGLVLMAVAPLAPAMLSSTACSGAWTARSCSASRPSSATALARGTPGGRVQPCRARRNPRVAAPCPLLGRSRRTQRRRGGARLERFVLTLAARLP